MAGSYQHYLQQMLQSGFRCSDSGKRYPSVWVFPKLDDPFRRRIEKFGGDKEFYSPVSAGLASTLDDKITRWEAKRQSDVREWRNLPNGSSVSSDAAAQLVGLTGMRTKAARQSIRAAMQEYIPAFAKMLQEPDILMTYLDEGASLDGFLKTAMEQELKFSGQPSFIESGSDEFHALLRMLRYALLESLGHRFSELLSELDQVFSKALNSETFDASSLHGKLLAGLIDDGSARSDLLALEWSIVGNETSIPWILPDCAVLSLNQNGTYNPFLFGEKDTRAAILLPLTPQRILIGVARDSPIPEISDFTKAAASCSQEFFIAPENAPEFKQFRDLIGSVEHDEITEGLQKALSQIDPLSTTGESDPIPMRHDLNVQVLGLNIDEAELVIIAKNLGSVIFELGQEFDLSRLNKITLCANVSEQIGAGENSPIQKYSETDYRNLLMWKEVGDGDLSYTLLFHINAAKALADEENSDYDVVRQLTAQCIAQIHNRTVLASTGSSLSSLLEACTDENLGPWARDVAMKGGLIFMDTFSGCRIATADNQYVLSVVEQFKDALATFSQAELPNCGDENQRNSAAEALSAAAADLLCSACRYLAACQSSSLSRFQFINADRSLKTGMEDLELHEWLDRLDFDLSRMRVGFNSPMQPEPIITLQRHLERLFWARGAVLIPRDGGYILPFADPTITYSKVASHLQKGINELIPNDLSEQLEKMLI
ncbi:hypothetical protein [Hoeflea prorocentri]|uniref:Uncharacterized protein n=1 Tax=Hoeflea prorocentri TaxID=1922333 RepID=A0A9X3UF65_9HYPH|nr:hypothetical protein [Hoeflea prorocentri]MCY6380238.1 hypothetical protein [Hoeflea prorocentri]MDA5398038.1 hypothetical protein [Hoeflea prorocentri]